MREAHLCIHWKLSFYLYSFESIHIQPQITVCLCNEFVKSDRFNWVSGTNEFIDIKATANIFKLLLLGPVTNRNTTLLSSCFEEHEK